MTSQRSSRESSGSAGDLEHFWVDGRTAFAADDNLMGSLELDGDRCVVLVPPGSSESESGL